MAFPESVVIQAWNRSKAKCECTRTSHYHLSRCNKALLWGSRGSESEYGWEAHHIIADGPDTVSNCEILCQKCHKATGSYGG